MTLQELGEVKIVTVSKEREEVWKALAAIYVLAAEYLRRSGGLTIPGVPCLVPGVEAAQISSDLWSLGTRGFGSRLSSMMPVFIDGRSVYFPLFAGVYWEAQNIAPEDIDRIEVILGTGITVWGANAVNGVINSITQDSRPVSCRAC